MSNFTFKNYRRVLSADFELGEKLTLLDGNNSAGKSTVLRGLKALFTGDVGTTKASAPLMVTRGAVKGELSGNGVSISYPKLTIVGAPEIAISENAADLRESVVLKDKKDAMLFFVDLFKASPTKEDLIEACNFIKSDDKLEKVAKIWDMIQSVGWTQTETNIKKYATGQSSNWKVHANETFGSVKAANWKHADWSFELDNLSENDIKSALEEAKQMHEDAIAANAISDEKMKELEKLIGTEDAVKAEYEALRKDYKTSSDKIVDLKKDYEKTTTALADANNLIPAEQNKIKCPCCDKDLILVGGKLEEPKELSLEELSKITDNLTHAQLDNDSIKSLLEKEDNTQRNIIDRMTSINKTLASIESAKTELNKIDDSVESSESPSQCAEEVERWEKLLNAYIKTREAKKCYESYIYYKELEKVIGVNGVRKTKVTQAVSKFNAIADKLFPKWQYRADEDFSVTDDIGTEYKDLSDGQKWCARVLFQVVSSFIAGDKLVLIDVIENVDRDFFKELCMQLHTANIKAVIARASDTEEKEVLEIEKLPGCKRYTLKNGVLR